MTTRARAIGLAAAAGLFPTRALAQSTLPIKIAATANDTYGEAYYALDGGFFARNGLDAQILTFTNGAQTTQAVAASAADIAVNGPLQLAIAITHGVPFQLLAGGALYSSDAPTTALYVARDSPIDGAKDLVGKTVAFTTLRDNNVVALDLWLRANGVDRSMVQVIEMAFSEMGPALVRGTIAAAAIAEPAATVARSQIRPLANFYDGLAKRWLLSTWFTRPDFAQKNPEAVRRFAAAMYATAHWANTHHPETAVILSKYAGVSLDVTRAMTRTTFAYSLDPKLIQPPLDYAFQYKLLDRPVRAAELLGGS